jgi:hypothetical protein
MSNPSIERTPYGMLRMPPVAAHVERYASAQPASQFACCWRAAGSRAESSHRRVAAQMNSCALCSLASRSQQSGASAGASFLSLSGLRGSRRNSARGSRHARRSAALNALHPSTPALVRSACASGTRYQLAFNPGSLEVNFEVQHR